MKHIIPELLSPAGNPESLKAAVENGADAIYLGSKEFSARGHADNFNNDQLLRAIDFAHQRDVSAYITVNTLVKEQEIEGAVEYLEQLCNHGADAVIVQDQGILNILNKHLPGLPVHASTQMSIHNSAGTKLLESMGVKRAVLARELDIEEINTIRSATDIQLEVFVHGAMCICYSGRCLMSSFIGGRSGNRGYCAQPCRKEYSLERNTMSSKYLLSPRDLNLSSRLQDLITAGVDSIKIEGRMKRPEYVAVVTRIYRDILDRLSTNPTARATPDEMRQLEVIFNRGFNEGYLNGDPGRKLMSMDAPGNRKGILLGHVTGSNPKRGTITVKLDASINVGDGIMAGGKGTSIHLLWMGWHKVSSAQAGEVVTFPYGFAITTGTPVFRTFDSILVASARNTYRSVQRKVPVTLQVEAIKGNLLLVRMSDHQGNTGESRSESVISPARQQPLDEQALRKQVSKLGDTYFQAEAINIRMDDDIFIPLSLINSARREAIEELSRLRLAGYCRVCGSVGLQTSHTRDEDRRPLLSVRVAGAKGVYAAVLGGANRVYVDIEGITGNEPATNAAIEKAHMTGVTVFIRLPDIVKDKEMALVTGTLDKLHGVDGILATGPDQIYMLREMYDLLLAVDYPANVFNTQGLDFLTGLGACSITVSPELTLDEIASISAGYDIECLVQGSVQLMVSEHCLIGGIKGCDSPIGVKGGVKSEVKGSITTEQTARPCQPGSTAGTGVTGCSIRDKKGFVFPVRHDNRCRTHIYNSKELALVDSIPDILEAGVRSLRIDGMFYDAKQVEEVTMLYSHAIETYLENPAQYDGTVFLSRLKKMFPGNLTTGHYFRGVQ